MKAINANAGYEGLIESFEVEVLLVEEVGDWQGDSLYLLRDQDRYGILVFGWGSCSGCDAFEAAAYSEESLTELRDELWASVQWFTREEVVKYAQGKDVSLEWYGQTAVAFYDQVVSLLR